MNTFDAVLIIGSFLLFGILMIIARIAEKVLRPHWKLLYLLPGGLTLCIISYRGFHWLLFPVILSAVVVIAGFVMEKRKVRTYSCIFGMMMALFSGILCFTIKPTVGCDYADQFEKAFVKLKKEYILAEQKSLDLDELYSTYYPMFEQANKKHDAVLNTIAWVRFTNEFHDGHVAYFCMDEKINNTACEQMYGNDYGLSIMRLDDGKFVAVNVAKDLVPLTNGCEILSWNGEEPETLLGVNENPIVYMPNMPVYKNEEFYQPLLIAGIGGDTVNVTYKGENGNTETIILYKRGFYSHRLEETLEIINRAVDDIGTLSWKELDENTCLFRIKQMSANLSSYGKDNYQDLQNSMRKKMLAYREAGFQTLIFDIRNNGGGDPYMIMAIASLIFPKGEHYYCSTAIFNEQKWEFEQNADGSFKEGDRLLVEGEDIWNQGKVIVLVNAASISAADHFVYLIKKCPNVTVMGFTSSNSSGQAVNAIQISDTETISYSAVPTLTKDGKVLIDTDSERVSNVEIDHVIGFDEKAVKVLFDENEDYILNYALEY